MANNCKHKRINPITGTLDYYFPMEILYPEQRIWAMDLNLEICHTRLGFRYFEAVMVPCKEIDHDEFGREFFVDTPTEEQSFRYHAFIKDELKRQAEMKIDGRCYIPDGHGGIKQCPCRIANPHHTPENGEPRTLPVQCEGCPYQSFKQAYTVIPMSAFDPIDEDGNVIGVFEPVSIFDCDQVKKYEELSSGFEEYVRARKPKLAALAHYLTLGYKQADFCRLSGDSHSTITSRVQKLQELLLEFLDGQI